MLLQCMVDNGLAALVVYQAIESVLQRGAFALNEHRSSWVLTHSHDEAFVT